SHFPETSINCLTYSNCWLPSSFGGIQKGGFISKSRIFPYIYHPLLRDYPFYTLFEDISSFQETLPCPKRWSILFFCFKKG
ncbi:hypothetical protein S245_036731, partial [Arachis hypogaea]